MVTRIIDKTKDLLKNDISSFTQLYRSSFKTQVKTLYIVLLFITYIL